VSTAEQSKDGIPGAREALLERQLAEARQELESFTYSVSHDLKSPLHTIKGFVEIVLEDLAVGRTQNTREDLQRVSEAADILQGQLETILDLSRLGRATLEQVEMPVEHLWEGVRRRWSPAFERVGGRLELAGSARVVWGDPSKLTALLDHLLDNALSFRRPDHPLQVKLLLDQEGAWVKGQVCDNGRGVPAEHLERIFDLFRKLNPETRGRGAGLSFARKIATLHGGRMRAESGGLGAGLCILFELPLSARQPRE
jgi:signal transduction histidine kinase